MKVQHVTWADHSGSQRWTEISDPDLRLFECETIGYVVAENDEALVLASTLSPDDRYTVSMTIAKSCIRKRRTVKL